MATQLELKDIQGIILSGYAHLNEATYLFLKVEDAAQGRTWLSRIMGEISNAASWDVDASGKKLKPMKQIQNMRREELQAYGTMKRTVLTNI